MEKLRIGVSRCLLGDRVRYDGQHKRDAFIVDTLGRFVEYVPVCPEVECGLPVPRESMRLVGDPNAPRLVTLRTKRDLTEQMLAWTDCRLTALAQENLGGFIFKAKSPSSGMERVKVYTADGGIAGSGSGLFAQAFMQRFPLLPTEEEGRLHDPVLRENFVTRIFTLQRYRAAVGARPTLSALMQFHAEHKYLIMAHSAGACRAMGKLLADSGRAQASHAAQAYETQLLAALKLTATVRKHCNVLQHMLGYFKKSITADEKEELQTAIDRYHDEFLPLIVPVTLINHFVRKYQVAYLAQQTYLNPHPIELKLRNHA